MSEIDFSNSQNYIIIFINYYIKINKFKFLNNLYARHSVIKFNKLKIV